jgi:predicted nucleic acid-binding protein
MAKRPAPERAPVRVAGHVGPRTVLVDSGPLVALFNRSDAWHERVLLWIQANSQARMLTTWPVLTEVCALLARRIANEAALDFLRWASEGALVLDAPSAEDLSDTLGNVLRISECFRDLPFDLADASIAEAALRHGIQHVLTIDSDFDVYRDAKGKALRPVLRDGW